jgi:hypothetical protein
MGDEMAEKASRNEFMQVMGGMLQQMGALIAADPTAAKFCGELLKFGLAPFRAGRALDGAVDEFVEQVEAKGQQGKGDDPTTAMGKIQLQIEQMKQQTEMQKAQMHQQIEQAKLAQNDQHKQMELASKQQIEQMKLSSDGQDAQVDMAVQGQKMQESREAHQAQLAANQQKMQLEQQKAAAQMAQHQAKAQAQAAQASQRNAERQFKMTQPKGPI